MRFISVMAGAVGLLALAAGVAQAGEAADIARETKLPESVVAVTLAQIDAFYQSPQGPGNRLSSGIVKELALKAIKDKIGRLDGAAPGKISDAASKSDQASFAVSVKTTRHDLSEQSDCVENKVSVSVSEYPPVIKDGAFVLDTAHPKVSAAEWPLSFCRQPTGNGDYGPWQAGQ